jgi:hypothetical protein
MRFTCFCGNSLSNTGQPNDIEHVLLSSRGIERLQDLADAEVSTEGTINEWPEHWEESGAIDVWKCSGCNRLYVFPRGSSDFDKVVVYSVECVGITSTG